MLNSTHGSEPYFNSAHYNLNQIKENMMDMLVTKGLEGKDPDEDMDPLDGSSRDP